MKNLFRFAKMSDRRDLIDLWYTCFGDSEKFVSPFLDCFLKEDTAYVSEEAGKVVSVVYALDCMIGDKKACYFYAVATDYNFRRRGLARKEIEFLIDYKKKQGAEVFLLTASSEKNNAYYKTMGFEDSFYCNKKTFEKTDKKVPVTTDFDEDEIFALRKKVFSGDKFVSFEKNHVDFAIKFSDAVYVWRENGEITAYAMTDGKKITELCCEKDKEAFVSSVLEKIDAEKAHIYLPLRDEDCCKISRGMVYCSDRKISKDTGDRVFLSLNLE